MSASFWTAPWRRPLVVMKFGWDVLRASTWRRGNFARWSAVWIRHGGDPRWALPPSSWLVLRREVERLPPGAAALELGSGLAGLLMADCGLEVTTVDHDPVWLARVAAAAGRNAARITPVHAPLEPTAGGEWYATERMPSGPFALVVIDGPPEHREAILEVAPSLVADAAIVALDNADWPAEERLACAIAARRGDICTIVRGFAVIRPDDPRG